jgi:hypothetical protein
MIAVAEMARSNAPIRGQRRPSIIRVPRGVQSAHRVVILGRPDDYDPVRRAGIPCIVIRRSGRGEPVVHLADVERLASVLSGRTGIVTAQDCPTRYAIWSWPYPVARMLAWYGVAVEVADLHVPHGVDAPAATYLSWQSADALRDRLDAAIPLAEHMVTMFPAREPYENRVDRLYEIALAAAPLPVAEREALVGEIMNASGRTEGTVRGALREAVETYDDWQYARRRHRR